MPLLENSRSFSTVPSQTSGFTWQLKQKFKTHNGIRVTVRSAKEDPSAIIYCLKIPNSIRFLLQRTSQQMILVSSDRHRVLKFIACDLN